MESLKKAGSSLLLRLQSSRVLPHDETQDRSEEETKESSARKVRGGKDSSVLVKRQSSFFSRLDKRSSWLGRNEEEKSSIRKQALRFRRLQRRLFEGNEEEMPGHEDWKPEQDIGYGSSGFCRERDNKSVKRVLAGHPQTEEDLRGNLDKVNVFFACNQSDSQYERDCFHAFVVPYLRQLCQVEGLELQVFDLISHVREELLTTAEHKQLVARTLADCLARSAALSFIGFLGDKFGSVDLPLEIQPQLFQKLIQQSSRATHLLEELYALDKGCTPAVFRLRPLTEVLNLQGLNAVTPQHAHLWQEKCNAASKAFLDALLSLGKRNDVEEATVQELLRSQVANHFAMALENWKEDGLLLAIREFVEVEGVHELHTNPKFSDVGANQTIESIREQLGQLKAKIRKHERSCAVSQFHVPFDGTFDPIRNATHAQYLRSLLATWTRQVETAIAKRRLFFPDETFDEAQRHLAYAFHLASSGSFPRPDLVQPLHVALRTKSTPIVHGAPGTGKTCLLAQLVKQLSEQDEENVIVFRTVDRKTNRQDLSNFVYTLYAQITRAYGFPVKERSTNRPTYTKAVELFWRALLLPSKERPLYLVIDGLDQLAQTPIQCLSWLPTKDNLPESVQFVFSCTSYADQTVKPSSFLPTLRSKFLAREIYVPALQNAQLAQVLNAWQAHDNHILTPHQQNILLAAAQRIDQRTMSCFRLLFEQTKTRAFKSSSLGSSSETPHREQRKQDQSQNERETVVQWESVHSPSTAFDLFAKNLECDNSVLLIRKVLALVSCSTAGLSLMELQDLLSLDSEYLASEECFEDASQPPTVPRAPMAPLARVLADLAPLWCPFETKFCANRFVLKNQQHDIVQACRVKYLNEPSLAIARQLLADYFSNSPKTSQVDIPRLDLRLSQNRLALQQPMLLETRAAKTVETAHLLQGTTSQNRPTSVVNCRSLEERIPALLSAGRFDLVFQIVMDPVYIRAMLEAGTLDLLLDQLRNRSLPDQSLCRQLWRALRLSEPTISESIDQLEEQLWGRLEPEIGSNHPLVKTLDAARQKRPVLHSRWSNALEPASGALVSTFSGNKRPLQYAIGAKLQDGRRVVISIANDATIKVWDLETSRLLGNLFPSQQLRASPGKGDMALLETLVTLYLWDGRVLVAAAIGCNIQIWNVELGTHHTTCEGHILPVTSMCTAECDDGTHLIISGSMDETLRAWDAKTGQPHWVRQVGSPITKLCNVEYTVGESHVCATSAQGELTFWQVSTGMLKNTVNIDDIPPQQGDDEDVQEPVQVTAIHCIVMAQDNITILSCALSTSSLFLFQADTGVEHARCIGHRRPIRVLCSLYSADRPPTLASAGEDHSILIWNCQDGEKLQTLEGHTGTVSALVPVQVGSNRPLCLASAAEDATVCVWDVLEGKLLWKGLSHQSAVSSLHCIDLASGEDCIISASLDKTLRVWDPTYQSKTASHAFGNDTVNQTQWICEVCPIYNEKKALNGPMIASASIDGSVQVVDASSRATMHLLRHHTKPVQTLFAHGRFLLSGGEDKVICVWDLKAGKLAATCTGHKGKIWSVCVTNNAKGKPVILSGSDDKSINFWAFDGTLKKTCQAHKGAVKVLCPFASQHDSLEETQDLTVSFASGSDDSTVKLWTPNGDLKYTLADAHTGAVHSLAYVPARNLLASGSCDNTVCIWDIRDGTCQCRIETGSSDGLGAFCLSQQTNQWCFVTASFTHKAFSFWDASSGAFLAKSAYPTHGLSAIQWTKNGVAILGAQDGRLAVFDGQVGILARSKVPVPNKKHSIPRSRPRTILQQRSSWRLLRSKTTPIRRTAPAKLVANLQRRLTSTDGLDSSQAAKRDDYEAESPKNNDAHEAILLGVDSWRFFS